jgi:hypothetical protein
VERPTQLALVDVVGIRQAMPRPELMALVDVATAAYVLDASGMSSDHVILVPAHV